jgi:hypothetical protein
MDLFDLDKKPNYIIKEPFRFVEQYEHVFKTNVKGRWIDKTILEAFSNEFVAYSEEYYVDIYLQILFK